MDVSSAIRTKRAVRQFQDKPLPEAAIQAILYAGRRAQSSKNTQPWNFIALRDKTTLKALSECGTWAGHLAGAALGVALIHSDPRERFQILFDIGQTAAYMQLAAWELGIASCLASIYEEEKARLLLGFPDQLHIRFAISFGYAANQADLTRPPQMNGRRPAVEVIHWEKW
jgi:nitroreductase